MIWRIWLWNRRLPNDSAWRRMAARSNVRVEQSRIAAANASTVASLTRMPVTPSTTLSSAPPSASATTGRPQACASTGTMPKSSTPGMSGRAAAPIEVSNLLIRQPARESHRRARRLGEAPQPRLPRGHAPRWSAAPPSAPRRRWRVQPLVGHQGGDGEEGRLRRRRGVRRVKVGIDRGIHNGRPAIIVSADSPRNIMRIRHIAVHPARRVAIPPRQPGQHRPQQRRPRSPTWPRRNRRRTDPTRSASASGSSRGGARRPGTTTDFAAQWLVLITRSKRSKSNCSMAVGKSGRYWR